MHGYIVDSRNGETLIAANIAILETGRGTTSNSSGYYSLTNLQPGTYTLIASYIGYHRFERVVELEAGQALRLDIELVSESFELEEIVVTSEKEEEARRNIGMASMPVQQIREVPAVMEPDVFRSVQLLPGVKAASDFSSGLYIRGGSPDQTLILLDETTVYNPSHFFGFYSTFNPDAVKDIQLYKGGYPARYGGRLGSVLSVYNKDGNRNELQGRVSVGMLASRAMLEGPHKWGSWMFAVRRSTLEPLLAAMRQEIDNVPDLFYFVDLNGKVNFDVSEKDRFSVAFYSGGDRVVFPFEEDAEISLGYGNRTLSTNWRHIFSERLFGTVTLTASRYFNTPEFEIAGTPFDRNNNVYDYSAKADLEYLPGANHTLSTGFWTGYRKLTFRDRFDNEVTFNERIENTYASFYLQDRWQPSDRWVLEAGVRGNWFSSGDYVRIEPRASMEFRPSNRVRLQAAYGRYYQFLTLVTNEAFSGFDLWLTTDEGVPPSWGDQYVLGVKSVPFDSWGFDVELYYRTMRDLFELNPFVVNASGMEYPELFRFGEGHAYGVEVFLERRIGRLTGFAGYTFGVTRRKFPGFNAPVLDDPARARFYSPKYDRTHDVNLVLNYELSRRWKFTAIFNYATGQAYTEPTGRMQIIDMPWSNLIRETFIVEKLNDARLPDYHRLDIAFTRKGTFFKIADAEWQFQLINVYSRRNIWFYQYDFDKNPVEREEVALLPIIPSFSYTVHF